MIRSYEDLEVYQKSYRLAVEMHGLSKKLPKDENLDLGSQMRRAALSIPLNIAEGYGKRESTAEFKRFLSMAKGSCEEMKVLAEYCKDVGHFEEGISKKLKADYDEVGKMLYGLRENWQ